MEPSRALAKQKKEGKKFRRNHAENPDGTDAAVGG
jgi:hypothetical protein